MPSSARITLLGHLARDVELRKAGEASVVGNAIAVTKYAKGSETTSWFDVTFWRRDAEAVEKMCNKGALLLVEGEIYMRKWNTKEGQERLTPTVEVSHVKIIDGKKDRAESEENLADRF